MKPVTAPRPNTPAAPPRPVIEPVHPVVDGGRYLAKASTVEPVVIEADVFADGHERLGAAVVLRHDATQAEVTVPLAEVANDRWRGEAELTELGHWRFVVTAWLDEWEYWRRALRARTAAGLDVSTDMLDGAALLSTAASDGRCSGGDVGLLRSALLRLEDGDTAVGDDELVADAMGRWAAASPEVGRSEEYGIEVVRPRAAHGAWYELFPRSPVGLGAGPFDARRHGTFDDVAAALPHIADLGFQVVYLPPIHPIGRTARKGPDNTLDAGSDDPGSPWAIGGAEGGHVAIHPDLGSDEDFRRLVARAGELGLEVALDLAFQCSPDHPWVREHPDWFRHRADGSIRTAENPPKRYEDIYPIDFTTPDWRSLWAALAEVVRHWMDRGVRIFRVDNPHTKPFAFWEWLIADIRSSDPDVVFLSEAFTRPRVLERLAKLGFDQSYGYFTWKRTAWELREYFEDLDERTRDFLRINVWPNTPDILTDQLQTGDRPMFETRAVLAATLSANWGVYGPPYELLVGEAVRPGSEEYRHSEKYEVRHWDLTEPDSLAPLLGRLNAIRAEHPALRTDRTRTFHRCDDPETLCWSKRWTDGRGADDTLLMVVNVAADHVRAGMVHLDLDALGLDGGPFEVHDLLSGASYSWHGADNYVELGPGRAVAHVLEIRP